MMRPLRITLLMPLALVALMLALTSLPGCNVARFMARTLEPETTQVEVKAEYLGLQNKSIAVMVIPNSGSQLMFPEAELELCKAVTRRLNINVPGVKAISPEDIIAYQKSNPHWITLPYSELLAALKVDRIVHISLTNYDVHEPGNRHVWRGNVSARVSVAEAESANPDNFVFSKTITAMYPADGAVPLLHSDRETIEMGMVKQFAHATAGLFYDYEFERKN